MRGGLGTATVQRGGIVVGAIMVVNAVGDVRDPRTGRLIAGARDAHDGRRLIDTAAAIAAGAPLPAFRPVNTTIGAVLADAALGKADCARIARLAMDGLARAVSPPHLPADGDTLFCLSVGERRADLDELGAAAADSAAAAIVNAVLAATPLPGLPTARELAGW